MTVAAVVPVTHKQIQNLAALDLWLEHGPHYGRNALIGAALGAGLFAIKYRKTSGVGKHTVTGVAAGVAAGLLGSFLFFQVGKWASKKEHVVLASAEVPPALQPAPTAPARPVVTKGYFAGAPRALYPTVDTHHHAYR